MLVAGIAVGRRTSRVGRTPAAPVVGSPPQSSPEHSAQPLLADGTSIDRAVLYRLIAEQSVDLIALVDENERVVYASPAFERILGRAPDTVVGGTLGDFVDYEDMAAMGQELAQTITCGTTCTVTMRARHSDGSLRWLDARANLLRGGNARFVLFVGRDVTERCGLEEQLIEAQKLESVGQLAGGVAHDFNNIILVLDANVEWLTRVLPPEHEARPSVADLRETAAKARGLTQQLLALARRQVLERRDVDLNESVARFVELIRRMLGERIKVVFEPSEHPAQVRVDLTQLDQVLMNLAVNARDAMPDGGELRFAVSGPFVMGGTRRGGGSGAYAERAHRALGSQPQERNPMDALMGTRVVQLVVEDSGEGMDADTLKKAFEPFFTTKGPGKGTGLGLSTTYGIVRQHGGVIRIISEKGRGARFEIILPELTEERRASGPISVMPRSSASERRGEEVFHLQAAAAPRSSRFPPSWGARLRPEMVAKCPNAVPAPVGDQMGSARPLSR